MIKFAQNEKIEKINSFTQVNQTILVKDDNNGNNQTNVNNNDMGSRLTIVTTTNNNITTENISDLKVQNNTIDPKQSTENCVLANDIANLPPKGRITFFFLNKNLAQNAQMKSSTPIRESKKDSNSDDEMFNSFIANNSSITSGFNSENKLNTEISFNNNQRSDSGFNESSNIENTSSMASDYNAENKQNKMALINNHQKSTSVSNRVLSSSKI